MSEFSQTFFSDIASIRIQVSDYRCFRGTREIIEGLKHINILVGRNNSGKSTFLSAVRFALAGNLDGAVHTELDGAVSIGIAFDRDQYDKMHFQAIAKCGEGQEVRAYRPSETAINYFVGQYCFADRHRSEFRFSSVTGGKAPDDDAIPIQEVGKMISECHRELFDKVNWLSVDSERDVRPESSNFSRVLPNGNGVTSCIEGQINQVDFNRLDLVEVDLLNALNQILTPDNHYERLLVRRRPNQEWEIFLIEENKGAIALSSTGSGIKTILQILTNLILVPKVFCYDNAKVVYAFEELENNLHPTVLRRLFEFIRNFSLVNDCCIFITTHSHVVIDQFSSDENAQIIHLTHDGYSSNAKTITSRPDGYSVLQDLGVKASDLLQTNVVVWVEGPTDAILFEKWIEVHSRGEIRRGVDYQCVIYGGSNGKHVTFDHEDADRLIEALKVCRHGVFIVDSNRSDAQGKIDAEAQRVVDSLKISHGIGWITQGREIENYLPLDVMANAAGVDGLDCDGFSDIYEAIRFRKGTKGELKKVPFVMKMLSELHPSNMYSLDLRERLNEISDYIRSCNARR